MDVSNKTTFHLECILSEFTWYDNNLLKKVKRELDKSHRKKLINSQLKKTLKEFDKMFGFI